MNPKGFLREGKGEVLLVGAEDKECDYSGPVAEVYAKDRWLFIVTDSYEGCAMLNLEALPYLRRALAVVEKRMKEGKKATGTKAESENQL